jgi:hypothetical protein
MFGDGGLVITVFKEDRLKTNKFLVLLEVIEIIELLGDLI